MLYETADYNDSLVFKEPPSYITTTSDTVSIFQLDYLRAGKYRLFAIKDLNKNNMFDQAAESIAFLDQDIEIPTDVDVFILNLFKEIPNYRANTPSQDFSNKIQFGFSQLQDSIRVQSLTALPDSVRTLVRKR